jgi:hypothetical protein
MLLWRFLSGTGFKHTEHDSMRKKFFLALSLHPGSLPSYLDVIPL